MRIPVVVHIQERVSIVNPSIVSMYLQNGRFLYANR